MNENRNIPAFLERREPAAVYMWMSTRRLVIHKDKGRVDLSLDDLKALRRFFDQFAWDETR